MYSICRIIPKINGEEGEARGQQEAETFHAEAVRGNIAFVWCPDNFFNTSPTIYLIDLQAYYARIRSLKQWV